MRWAYFKVDTKHFYEIARELERLGISIDYLIFRVHYAHGFPKSIQYHNMLPFANRGPKQWIDIEGDVANNYSELYKLAPIRIDECEVFAELL